MCLVEIKVSCFFLIFFDYSVLFWDLQASHEKTEYMVIFIKETNNVALVESKESTFQL